MTITPLIILHIFALQTSSTSTCNAGDLSIYSHPEDCSRFYRCVDGTIYAGTCHEGLLFDYITSRCIRASEATCEANASTTTPGSTTTTEPPFNLDNYCVIDEVDRLATVAHPFRCDWFIECIVGRGFLGRCGWQLIFNPAQEQCVPGDADTCELSGVTQEPVTTLTTPVTGGPDFNVDDFCQPDIVGSIATVAHPQRCDWYISCVVGRGFIGRCGWEQIFDATNARCASGNSDTCELL